MKKSKGFALVETLIVSTIIASILIYIFIQFNSISKNHEDSFNYNDVDDLYKLDSIKEYINSLDSTLITDIVTKINNDDIIIMDKNDDTYTNIEYLDNQVDLLANLDIKTLVFTKADINNVDTSNLSSTLKNMIKKIDNKSDNYRIIAEFNNGNSATITVSFEYVLYDGNGNEYTPVEYLESSGTQYIDTGIIPNLKQKYNIKYSVKKEGNQIIFGSRSSGNYLTSKDQIYLNGDSQNKWVLFVGTKSNYISDVKTNTDFEFNLSVSDFDQDFNNLSTYPIYIFSLNIYGTVASAINEMKLYYFKIYDDNVLVRDYIPVINLSGRPCLFDRVGKVCYYNQGTGEFLWK